MNLRKEILKTCFMAEEVEFASGTRANNKLDLEKIPSDPKLRDEVVKRIGANVLEHDPEFVVGVPDGARWLADSLARELDLYTFHLKRVGEARAKIDFEFPVDREVICRPLERGVLVEDVFNKFTNTRRTLLVPELAGRVVAAEAIWDRGSEPREQPDLPCRALITEPIDPKLPETSELWDFAR